MKKTGAKKTITKPMRFSPEDARLLAAGASRNSLSEAAYVRMLVRQDDRNSDQKRR